MCGEEKETFSHTMLRCQLTSYYRERLLHDLSDWGPDSLLWSSKELLLSLATFIRVTATDYRPDMFSSHPLSPASRVCPSSPTQGLQRLVSSSSPCPV